MAGTTGTCGGVPIPGAKNVKPEIVWQCQGFAAEVVILRNCPSMGFDFETVYEEEK